MDVALLVQLAVSAAQWISTSGGPRHRRHALRRRDQVDELDPDRLDRAPALQDLDGSRRRAAGREHRIEDQAQVDRRRVRQLVVVLDRPQVRSSRNRPRCQTCAVGISSSIASTMPSPARRIGTRPIRSPSSARHLLERRPDLEGGRRRRPAPRSPGARTARGRPRGTSSARSSRRAGSRACAGPPDAARRGGSGTGLGAHGQRLRARARPSRATSPSQRTVAGILGSCRPHAVSRPAGASGAPPARRGRKAPPILVRQLRNGIEESVHRGDVVEVDVRARHPGLGDPERVVNSAQGSSRSGWSRSSRPAASCVRSRTTELAFMASSHSGEDIHVRTLQAMYRRAGVTRRCSPAGPRECRSTR